MLHYTPRIPWSDNRVMVNRMPPVGLLYLVQNPFDLRSPLSLSNDPLDDDRTRGWFMVLMTERLPPWWLQSTAITVLTREWRSLMMVLSLYNTHKILQEAIKETQHMESLKSNHYLVFAFPIPSSPVAPPNNPFVSIGLDRRKAEWGSSWKLWEW